jgi:denticleless
VSSASKRGQESRLAVATEQGAVLILDVSARKDWDPEPPRSVLRPHRNGIFDVCWSPSDIRLATCSADHTAAICDPLRPDAAPLQYLHGHQGTLKCVAWHTDDVLATGGRDGKIRVWDLRLQGRQNGTLTSVMTLSEKAQPVKTVKKAKLGAAPSKSITGILFADGYDSTYSIISSTSTDGYVLSTECFLSLLTKSYQYSPSMGRAQASWSEERLARY